jgi:hypothetical protein
MSTTPNSPPMAQMPPKLSPDQLAALSQEERSDRLDQIEAAAIDQVRFNKEQFLKDHPNLDFRNKK